MKIHSISKTTELLVPSVDFNVTDSEGNKIVLNNVQNDREDQVVCHVTVPTPDQKNIYREKQVFERFSDSDGGEFAVTTNISECVSKQCSKIEGLESMGIKTGKELVEHAPTREFNKIQNEIYAYVMDSHFSGVVRGLDSGEGSASE